MVDEWITMKGYIYAKRIYLLMKERFMVVDDEILFMVQIGVWVQYDEYDVCEGSIYLYNNAQCVAILNGMDANDFMEQIGEYANV